MSWNSSADPLELTEQLLSVLQHQRQGIGHGQTSAEVSSKSAEVSSMLAQVSSMYAPEPATSEPEWQWQTFGQAEQDWSSREWKRSGMKGQGWTTWQMSEPEPQWQGSRWQASEPEQQWQGSRKQQTSELDVASASWAGWNSKQTSKPETVQHSVHIVGKRDKMNKARGILNAAVGTTCVVANDQNMVWTLRRELRIQDVRLGKEVANAVDGSCVREVIMFDLPKLETWWRASAELATHHCHTFIACEGQKLVDPRTEWLPKLSALVNQRLGSLDLFLRHLPPSLTSSASPDVMNEQELGGARRSQKELGARS